MLKREDNELIGRVGPGTPMGNMMRRYWHPIAATAEIDDNPFRTKAVRILGEDLALFRDRSGKLGLRRGVGNEKTRVLRLSGF